MSKKKEKTQKWVSLTERFYDQDPTYWGMPLYERAYLRVIYALVGFIAISSIFDVWTGAPLWMQILLGVSVAAAILLFRVAYPKGFASVWEWTMEGMAEAAEEMEKRGKTPKMSSKDLKRQLEEQRTLDAERKKNAKKK